VGFVGLLAAGAPPDDAATSTVRILETMAQVHCIDGQDLYVTASAGISIYSDDGGNAETLMKNADTAMYQAKVLGKDTFRFFKAEMNERAVERRSVETALRHALERQEFELHYQPQINLVTGLTSGVEALIRWNHPTRGLIAPAQFISIAEDCRLILPIGQWVLGEACRQAQSWARAGLWCGTIAVNVSAVQFREHDFVQVVMDILEATGMDPSQLELELTESVLMTTGDCAASALQTLRNAGVKVALDDFGTGYSSLSYLGRFPVDCVKIDQAFIRQISAAGTKNTLVAAIINMGHALGLRVVAEGVETEEERQFVQDRGCDEGQGYHFSKPLPLKAFKERLLVEGDRARFARC
jgi:EAL domain-containing protein (putative c-di-GMP-specific phosphodiesterase class I)